MSSLLKDLFAGIPQSANTLQALINQSKLGQQHYGPNDSVIASSIMHPIEGLNKASNWLQDQVNTVSNAPIQPYGNPVAANNATQASMGLAQLMQTGALPFAPTGLGVLGSIKRPQDIVTPYSLDTQLSPIKKLLANYRKNTWLTDKDELVKYVDSGGPIGTAQEIRMGNNIHHFPQLRPSLPKVSKKLGYTQKVTPYSALSQSTIISRLRDGVKMTPRANQYISEIQALADHARNKFGTQQVATTPAGKFFENLNDLNGVDNIVNPNRLKRVDPTAEDIYSIQDRANNKIMEQVASNPYYKANKGKINVFNSGNMLGNYYLDHLQDMNPTTGRASFSDIIRNTIRADDAAAAAAEKAKFTGQNAIDLNKKELVKELPNGQTWNKLVEPAALRVEGVTQGHCVATYEGKVARGEAQIFSLRSPDNKPILTAEWDPINKKMVQVRGKFNAPVTPELRPYVKDLENLLKSK